MGGNEPFVIVMAVMAVVFVGSLAFSFFFLRLWVQALLTKTPVSPLDLVRMKLRGCPPQLLVHAMIHLTQRGVPVTAQETEGCYLAGLVRGERVGTAAELAALLEAVKRNAPRTQVVTPFGDRPVLKPETIEKLKAAYKQWHDTRGQSVAAWMELMDDDVEMKSVADGAPGMEFSAKRKGKNTLHGYFSALNADWEMIHYTPTDFIVDGDRVAVFGKCSFRNRKTGKVAETDVANRWRFKDDRVVEFYEIYDTAKAFAAATPDPA